MMDTRRSTLFSASGHALPGMLLLAAIGGCNALLLLAAATALTPGFTATRTCCYVRCGRTLPPDRAGGAAVGKQRADDG